MPRYQGYLHEALRVGFEFGNGLSEQIEIGCGRHHAGFKIVMFVHRASDCACVRILVFTICTVAHIHRFPIDWSFSVVAQMF